MSAPNRPPFEAFGQGASTPDIDMLRDFFTRLMGGTASATAPQPPKSPRIIRVNGVEYCKLTERYTSTTIGQLMTIAAAGTLYRQLPTAGTKVQVKRLRPDHFEGKTLSYLRSELGTYYIPRD